MSPQYEGMPVWAEPMCYTSKRLRQYEQSLYTIQAKSRAIVFRDGLLPKQQNVSVLAILLLNPHPCLVHCACLLPSAPRLTVIRRLGR